jgi:hypothetical protein
LFSAVFLTKTLGLETGGNFAIGSGVMNDVASLPRSVQAFVLPLSMQGIETDENQSYKTIEFRRVGPNGRVFAYGQILIAYKTERTPDLARKMLVKALPTALGIDTTIEAVEQARKTDFENRKAIWAACVAAGDPRCKPN